MQIDSLQRRFGDLARYVSDTLSCLSLDVVNLICGYARVEYVQRGSQAQRIRVRAVPPGITSYSHSWCILPDGRMWVIAQDGNIWNVDHLLERLVPGRFQGIVAGVWQCLADRHTPQVLVLSSLLDSIIVSFYDHNGEQVCDAHQKPLCIETRGADAMCMDMSPDGTGLYVFRMYGEVVVFRRTYQDKAWSPWQHSHVCTVDARTIVGAGGMAVTNTHEIICAGLAERDAATAAATVSLSHRHRGVRAFDVHRTDGKSTARYLGTFPNPQRVATDSQGNVYMDVLDEQLRRYIQVITPQGTPLTTVHFDPPTREHLRFAIDAEDVLHVLITRDKPRDSRLPRRRVPLPESKETYCVLESFVWMSGGRL